MNSEQKRAYIVLGPESSGTRLLTRILIKAGCVGDDTHEQSFDKVCPKDETLVVWRRSVPHGGVLPPIADMIYSLKNCRYDVKSIVTGREWHAMLSSQRKDPDLRFHIHESEGFSKIQLAYRHIFSALSVSQIQYMMLSIESLVLYPKETIYCLMDFLGLPIVHIDIYDPNKKWYVLME